MIKFTKADKRLFLGVEVPSYVRSACAGLNATLPGFRWVAPRNIHLTLTFIGPADHELEEGIKEAVSAIQVRRFVLSVDGLGCFPGRRRPATLWVGLERSPPQLYQLQRKIEDRLIPVGIAPEERAYNPHITIARVSTAKPEAVYHFLKKHREFGTAPFHVTSFALFSSHYHSSHLQYLVERRWPLGER